MNHSNRARAWATLFLPFALGYYLSYLLRTVNAVISPDLTRDLALTAADLGLLTSAYFLAFGLAQIPLGIALDRFGPRRVEGALLVLASLGAAAFAVGETLTQLALARSLIGLGVSACLMAGLKGFAMWYPPERQSSMTGYIMAAGALGALTASTPVEALLPMLGWRGVFWILAAVAAGIAAFLFIAVPDEASHASRESPGETLRSVGRIFASPSFLRFAGSVMFFTGGFMALQSLWAVPWMMNVNGMTIAAAAVSLMVLNVGMLAGQLAIGLFGMRLVARGVTPGDMVRWGFAAMLAVQMLILADIVPAAPLWFLLGALSAVNAQAYIATATHFPKHAFGRVSTAINLMAFIGAFTVQWGMGLALDVLQGWEWTLAASLRIAFAGLIALQAVSLVPLVMRARVSRRQTN